ncbi:MAG: prolyl oligopeptidase family serine peptidase [Candidatus Binatia bacterium]
MSASPRPPAAELEIGDDPYLWLEDITSDESLAWVREQNAATIRELGGSAHFETLRRRLLAIFDSKARIPHVAKHGACCYNFWRDLNHVRGLWRRTTLDEYKKADPAWETVLDLDQMAESDAENWVWKGSDVLQPTHDRALIFLSRGGADAIVVREFDLNRKAFVPDGFFLPEAKTSATWRNRDALYIGTDFGSGSLTRSGYPRIVKEWKRHSRLADAEIVFEGQVEDVGVDAVVRHDHGHTYEFVRRRLTFFTNEVYVHRADGWVRIDKPADARLDTFNDQLLLRLRSDWTIDDTTYRAGALLATDLDAYLRGERKPTVLFEPTQRKCLAGTSATKNYLIVNELEDVRNKVYLLEREAGQWLRQRLDIPEFGSIDARGIDPDESDDYFLTVTDFLTPSRLYFGTVGRAEREPLKSLPAFFATDGLQVSQHEARSKDGTPIPYFQVSRKDLHLDGKNPLLLYGYGGFDVSLLPNYVPTVGSAWLEPGGVYVVANIRGGGEFGPNWHNAARKETRQRAYDDFIAVAEDLIARRVTSPMHLGIQGGSNGGLLMGVMLTQRPDLFKAVVCQMPLLDMKRFHKLLAGASWIDEYGDPDNPDDWSYIGQYSPYQNVTKDQKYPRVLFTTSTRDDRVHPGHARKMFAKMKQQGHDVLYFENIEGGHGGAADNQQAAYMAALGYAFLLKELWTEER